MQTFFAYHFLQSLSFALLNSLWQMAFLWIVYSFVKSVLQLNAKASYRGLVFIQFAGFAWFIRTFFVAFSLPEINSYFNIFETTQSFFTNKLLAVVAVIYLFFVLVFATKFLIQFATLSTLRKNNTANISSKWQTFVSNTSRQLNIKKTVVVKISKNITTPLTIGFLKPVILIPIASINNLTVAQLEAVLLHELAHIKRQDYIVNLVLMLIDTLLFFNPFSKCISKQIAIERELCCDDMVLQQNYSSTEYATALLTIAKLQLQAQPVFGALQAVSSSRQLKERVKRILNIEEEKTKTIWLNKQIVFAVSFGLILFLLIGFINTSVKNIITDNNTATNTNIAFTNTSFKPIQQVATAKHNTTRKRPAKAKKTIKENITAIVTNELAENRKTLKKGFEFIGKLATENKNVSTQTSFENDEDIVTNIAENTNEIAINAAFEKHPTTTVQQFFVPATSKSAASIIVVTTTEKEDGKKIVKIEIEKGNSKVE